MLFSGSMLAQIIGFAALYFLGRLYSPDDFGELEIFLKLSGVLIAIAGLRYEMAIVVENDKIEAINLSKLTLLLNLCFAVLTFVILLFFKDEIASLLNINKPNFLLFVPLIVWLTSSTETLILFRNRERQYKKITSNRVISSLSSTSYKLGHYFTPLKFNGLIAGHILGQILAFAHIAQKIPFRITQFKADHLFKLAKKYRQFPFFSSPAALLNILAVSMPVFLISAYSGTEDTGYFANAYKLTYLPMSMLAMALGQVFFERIARLKENKEQAAQLSHKLFNLLFAIGVIPSIILLVWGDSIAPFLLGDQWHEAGIYIQITILFYFTMFLTSTFSSAFETYGKLKVQLVYNAVFLVSTSLVMYLTFESGGETKQALERFATVGIVLRVLILNYFFYLFGKNIIAKTIFAVIIVFALAWLGFSFKH